MGLFDWFWNRSRVELAPDKIWLTKQARLDGIAAEIGQSLDSADGPVAIFLVGHFPDSVQELRTLAQRNGFPEPTVLVALAGELKAGSGPIIAADDSRWVLFLVAERHPLLAHDEALLQFAEAIPCRVRLGYHLALDEPLMRRFAGPWVTQVLERMGMTASEAIESRMVAARIRKEQRKIARRVIRELPACSAEEWLQLNCPAD